MDKVNQVLRLFGKILGPVDWRSEEGKIPRDMGGCFLDLKFEAGILSYGLD